MSQTIRRKRKAPVASENNNNNNATDDNTHNSTEPDKFKYLNPKNILQEHNSSTTFDVSGLQKHSTLAPETLPKAMPIQRVYKEYPALQPSIVNGPISATDAMQDFLYEAAVMGCDIQFKQPTERDPFYLANAAANKTPEQIQQLHTLQYQIKPWQLTELLKKIRTLKPPRFFFRDPKASDEQTLTANSQYTQENYNDMLRDGVLDLCEQDSVIENDLLCESGYWTHVALEAQYSDYRKFAFPPCANGDECIGCNERFYKLIKNCNAPILLTQVLFRDEYLDLLRKGRVDPGIPKRPCVLCCRYTLGDWITFLRANTMMGLRERSTIGSNPTPNTNQFDQFELRTKQVHQFYRNPEDCKNGYSREFMIQPKNNEPIIAPLVALNLTMLQMKTLPNGRRAIDQSALLYKPPEKPVPRTAENMRVF